MEARRAIEDQCEQHSNMWNHIIDVNNGNSNAVRHIHPIPIARKIDESLHEYRQQ